MKNQFTILALTTAGLLAVTSSIRAEDPVPPVPPVNPPAAAKSDAAPGDAGGRARMNPGERLKMMTEKLGLTQEQQDKIKAIFEKNAPTLKELMAKGRDNLTDADKAKLAELLKTQREEIAAVLTPEQKEKMKELRPGGGAGGGRAKPDAAK